MSNKCITEQTPIFEFTSDTVLEHNTQNIQQLNEFAKVISLETGVPQNMIYSAPYLFFINNWHKLNSEWYFSKMEVMIFTF